MTETIRQPELARMFAAAAACVRSEHARLSELDSIAGDGDHGATMLRVVDRLESAVAPGSSGDLKVLLKDAGWSILGVDGGASSCLLGTFFAGMADTESDASALDCRGFTAACEAGLQAASRQSKAQPGDKTMMDALVPAVAALRAAADSGTLLIDALRSAADAARAGAESTRNLIARHGRAKHLGEKTRGHQDPGATSVALLFEGFYRGLAETKGDAGYA